MIFHKREPMGDAPPGYWRHLAAKRRQNLLLALLGALGAGVAWWTDSHRLVQVFFSTLGGAGLLQFALGTCGVLGRSFRLHRGNAP